jgi:hypothetical protein
MSLRRWASATRGIAFNATGDQLEIPPGFDVRSAPVGYDGNDDGVGALDVPQCGNSRLWILCAHGAQQAAVLYVGDPAMTLPLQQMELGIETQPDVRDDLEQQRRSRLPVDREVEVVVRVNDVFDPTGSFGSLHGRRRRCDG